MLSLHKIAPFLNLSRPFLHLHLQLLKRLFSFFQLVQLKQEHSLLITLFLLHFQLFFLQPPQLFIDPPHLVLQLLVIDLPYFDRWLFFRLGHFFGFFRGRSFELRLIELAPLKLPLAHEALAFDPLGIVIWTFASIFEIHQPLKRNKPSPLLITIPGTKVQHVLKRPNLEPRRNHILLLPEIAFVGLDLS